jgi:hypothetical protein
LDTIADWILQNFRPNRRLLDAEIPENDRASTWHVGAAEVGFPKANQAGGQRADRRAAVDAYINEVLTTTGKVITRTHIWKKAGDKSRAEFERWESHWYEKHGRKPNRAADRRFTRILSEKPHLK